MGDNGLMMLLYQGVIAYQLWMGIELSEEVVEKAEDVAEEAAEKAEDVAEEVKDAVEDN